MTARVTVQFTVNGQHGERVARSETKTVQQMVDWMDANKKSGVTLRFLGEYGYIAPTQERQNAHDDR